MEETERRGQRGRESQEWKTDGEGEKAKRKTKDKRKEQGQGLNRRQRNHVKGEGEERFICWASRRGRGTVKKLTVIFKKAAVSMFNISSGNQPPMFQSLY